MEVTLKLSLAQVNRINELLSTFPFHQVSDLIMLMRGQAQAQFEASKLPARSLAQEKYDASEPEPPKE